MPARGGASGKLGDQYEVFWAVDAATRLVRGELESITYESLNPDAARGVEFHAKTSAGPVEYWSIKRQTTKAAGWTLPVLMSPDDRGRSILGDLVAHTERANSNIAVFASELGAAKLAELHACSATPNVFSQRLSQSKSLNAEFRKFVLPMFHGDHDRARRSLMQIRVRTVDEASLRSKIESDIAFLFYDEQGTSVDAAGIRRLLAEYLLNHMHQQIDRPQLLEHLASKGIRCMDWKVDRTLREKVGAICDEYARPLRQQLIGGVLQVLPGAEKLLDSDGLPIASRTLLSASAGGGKSSELAHVVMRLGETGIPTLPVRMDIIPDNVRTLPQLGNDVFSLPTSPVTALARIAGGGACVLVVDQLDAASLVSGRRADLWILVERMLREVDSYPNMRVIVACRAFDLEHDHRLRALKAQASRFIIVELGPFDLSTVDAILGERKTHSRLRPLLVTPLHLAMLLSLPAIDGERLQTRDQLFGAFWTEKQQKVSRRLGGPQVFAGFIDWLATRLSDHQELSAPEAMVPAGMQAEADAWASEHVVVHADGRYRFFHESFFDYVFARHFVQQGRQLTALLLAGEQHLFRRSQVRQILSFLRANDWMQYIRALQAILKSDGVRFHIKRVVLQSLSALTEPTEAEWTVLCELLVAHPSLTAEVTRVVANSVAWFDVLHAVGFLGEGLASCDKKQEEQVLWLCGRPEIMAQRSAQVATLLVAHRRDDEAWLGYLQYICRLGQAFHSREMFDLFLSLIRDGTLDGTRPGFAVNDNWWSILYAVADAAPEFASEAIAAWFDRRVAVWRAELAGSYRVRETISSPDEDEVDDDANGGARSPGEVLRHIFDDPGNDWGVIAKAAKAPLAFVSNLLPRVLDLVAELAKPCRDRLETDPLWSFRMYGGGHRISDLIFGSLASALERLALDTPAELDRLLAPYVGRPHDAAAYLVLRAWTAAPATYAERLATYLLENPRRLKIGYSYWSGDADEAIATGYRSIEAVRRSSPVVSSITFAALEAAIVALTDDWESRHPRIRGARRLQLLLAMDQCRLGETGRAKLAELKAKFPHAIHNPPEPLEVVGVGSPIPDDAQVKMSDDQWLMAMEKYAGISYRPGRDIRASGGELELARSLQLRAKADPKRFVLLGPKLPLTFPSSYFDAILGAVADLAPPARSAAGAPDVADIVALIERAHALPNRPCGRAIAHLLGQWSSETWPPSVLETIAWYGTEDPDPSDEAWRASTPGEEAARVGDPNTAGLNSVRGAAAGAIARMFFSLEHRPPVLLDATERLAQDESVAVRSQAIFPLLALLNTHPATAIKWFLECVNVDSILLTTEFVEPFVYHAAFHDYPTMRGVLLAMIASDDTRTVQAGARLFCALAFHLDGAKDDAKTVREGAATMRASAAAVYADHVASSEVGDISRELLLPFIADSDESVQAKAATAFRQVSKLKTPEQALLLAALLDGKPSAASLESAIRAIEDSPVKLPDLVCRLAEAGIETFKAEASDIANRAALVATYLAKIVIRLYAQSNDDKIRTRCLDLIDNMEQADFLGLAEEMGKIER